MPLKEETTEQIERRLLRWMIAAGLVAAAGTAVFYRPSFGAGVAGGAVVSVLGYYWLMGAVSGALSGNAGRVTKGLVIKLVLRYPILLGVLYLFYRTKWLPMEGVLAGLFVPLAGGAVECLYQVRTLLFPAR